MDKMNIIDSITEYFASIPTVAVLLAVLLVLMFIQIYLRTLVWRVPKPIDQPASFESPSISVVVVIHENDQSYIETHLIDILKQDYDRFEIIVVDCSYDEFVSQRLQIIQLEHPKLRVTTMRQGTGFDNCEKLAINIGFKAAIFDNLLLTSAKSYPTSPYWIASMAQSFNQKGKQIVIGYSTIEPTRKFYNRFTRCARLLSGMSYIGVAAKGLAYRGSRHNIAYTKNIYFESKGFNYLNMNIGENDLFVQKIASRRNTSINISPEAIVKEFSFNSMRDVFDNDVLRSTTHKLYPTRVKFHKIFELYSRAGFHYLSLALIAWLIVQAFSDAIYIPIYIAVVVMIILRLVAVMITANKAAKRLHDSGLMGMFPFFDFISPIYELAVWVKRTFSHNRSVWR